MKKKLLFLSLILFPGLISAQTIIWGAGSSNSTIDSIGRFAFDFGTPNGWNAVSVNDGNGAPGAAFWTKTMTGTTQGAYAVSLPAITSPSVSDGAALFDSDYMDNGGIQGNFGMGTSPSPHKGYLYSPIFDLTGNTDVVILARMFLQYRNFSITELSVGFSSDGGATWSDFDIQQGAGTNVFFDTDQITVPLTNVTAGVSNLTNCQMRLTFDGDYYFAMIDDISLITCSTTSSISATSCESYISPSGKIWTSSNTYLDTIPNTASCDSIITVNLTILDPATGTDTRTECDSYTWIDGINYTSSNNTATFTIVGGAANGCDSLVSLDLTINSVSDLTTSTSGATITSNNSSATFQWLDCDNNYAIISGETAVSFTPTSNGNFAVELTENGCVDTTSCIAISTVGFINNEFGNKLEVYPNPNAGDFSINLGSSYENSNITITDISGKLVFSKNLIQMQFIDISLNQPAGIYFVSIQADNKKAFIRLAIE